MKTCSKCRLEKHESEFYKRTNRASGIRSSCKLCELNDQMQYQKSPLGKLVVEKYAKSNEGRTSKKRCGKRYRQSDKGRLCAQQKARRRRDKKAMLDMSLTQADVQSLRSVFNHQCFNCGSTEYLELDHHRPLSRGYGLTHCNVVLLCKSCNSSKGNKMPEEYYTAEQLEAINMLHKQWIGGRAAKATGCKPVLYELTPGVQVPPDPPSARSSMQSRSL